MNILRKAASATIGTAFALGAVGALLLYASRGRNAQGFAPSVSRGAGRRRAVALTFDDGPSPGTAAIADLLAEYGIRATFFVCGVNLMRHPEIAARLHAAGHEIGNHSTTHRRLCPRIGWKLNLVSRRTVFLEFAQTQELIATLLGVSPCLLRVPYGLRWFGLRRVQRILGLQGILWTAIGHDWEWPASRVAAHLLRNTRPGAILCLHDGRDIRPFPDVSATVQVVRELVPALLARGYHFETVSQILENDALVSARADKTERPKCQPTSY